MKLEVDKLLYPKGFVIQWSAQYYDRNEDLYKESISKGLDDWDNFHNLFIWKNGMHNIFAPKLKGIKEHWGKIDDLRKLRRKFDWNLFERKFNPANSSAIWKIFLLHIVDPHEFPVFDQHVFRFHNFLSCGCTRELPEKDDFKYEYYRYKYLPFFRAFRDEYSLDPKKMDEAFFTYGKILRPIKGASKFSHERCCTFK